MPAELYPVQPLDHCREIVPAPAAGWPQLSMGEWELHAGEEHGDQHAHDEVNFVLEGLLVVECDGSTVQAGPGDVIRVPAGRPALYSAPTYARMVYAYGPNPQGIPVVEFGRGEVADRP